MSELQNGLIQMNAHMVRQYKFDFVIGLAIVAAIVFVMLAAFATQDKNKMAAIVFFTLAIIGVVVAVIASNQPKVKEIKACANGPVSIEQIAVVYDVVDIDGKMITLRER